MKRPLSAVVLALLLVASAGGALLTRQAIAAPAYQETRPVIAQPEPDAAVRGVVQIVGTATHAQFQRYELYYAPWPVPADNAWTFIGPDAHFNQQPLGLLGTWDSRAVADGEYALRVRVVKRDANYIDSEPRHVVVANTKPVETPTSTASPTPTETATPSAPEATVPPPAAVSVATVPPSNRAGAQAGATPTTGPAGAAAAPTAILAASGGDDTSSIISSAGQAFNVSRLKVTARETATYTLGAFAALGLFFGVKALLAWLWQKVRP